MEPSTRNPLLIPELFQCILDHFDPSSNNYHQVHAARETLAVLAQTCRALSEPSLDRLWRVLDSLYPLVRTFTSYERTIAYDEDNHNPDPEAFDGMDPPTPAQWAIINRYSHRVREVTIDGSVVTIRFLMSILSHPSPLFPNLEVLEWETRQIHHLGSLSLIFPLISPTLVKLHAQLTEEDSENLPSFLGRYYVDCPKLEVVIFRFRDGHDEPVSERTLYELNRALCSHKGLKTLEIRNANIETATMKLVAMSPTIKVVSIDYLPPKPYPQPYFRPEEIPFRNVEELDITTTDLDFLISLLRPRDQRWYLLRLFILDRPTAEATAAFFSLLASRPDTHTVKDVYIGFFISPPSDATTEDLELHTLSYPSFLPLTSFTYLEYLAIDWNHEISLDDDELLALARNWPYLKVFALNRYRGLHIQQTKSLTLEGLLMLAAACPNLVNIDMPLDARQIPKVTNSDLDIRHTSVQSLAFPDSRINEVRPVAEFLFKHFPRVERVFRYFHRLGRPKYAPTDMPMPLAYEYYKREWSLVDRQLAIFRQESDSESGSECHCESD